MNIKLRTWACLVAFIVSPAALVAPASGQTGVFMLEQGTDPACWTGTPTTIHAVPGQQVTIVVWFQDPASLDCLNTYQIVVHWNATGGTSGTVSYVDSNPPPGNTVLINQTDPAWVFINAPLADTLAPSYAETPGGDIFGAFYQYLPAQCIQVGPGSSVPNPGGPNYLMQFDLQISPTAFGTFNLQFNLPSDSPPFSAIFNQSGMPYGGAGVVMFQPLQIVVDQPCAGEQKLTALDAAAGDVFGISVSVSGDTAVVGAQLDDDAGSNSGSAYVFRYDPLQTICGEPWCEEQKLTALDAAADDYFGTSVSVSGDTAVVGAFNSGSAYVFRYDASQTICGELWCEEEKLTASDAAAGDLFGWSVSVSGDTAVVGAQFDDDAGADSGSAYAFRYDPLQTICGELWCEEQKLTASDAAADDFFGSSVSVSGDTVVVGAYSNDDAGANSGSAYVFRYDPSLTICGELWCQEEKLTAFDAATGDFFGGSVSVSGDTAVIGAYGNDDTGADSGSAYVFRYDPSLTICGAWWCEEQKLTAADAAAADYFGYSVSVSGDTAVVGAYGNDDAGSDFGSAYVFRYDPSLTICGESWCEEEKQTAGDAAAGDIFGHSVSVSGDTAVVGATWDDDAGFRSGSAYAYICGFERGNCVLPPPDMVSWWPGDGNADDIQDGNDGTLNNCPTFEAGKVGQAFGFDGVDDEINILKMSNLNMMASDFSIDAWVKFSQAPVGDEIIFLNYARVPCYFLYITTAAKAAVLFRPGVASTIMAPQAQAIGATSLDDGQWHHLVGVRSHVTALIYVDGALDGWDTNPDVLNVNGGSVDTSGCLYARIGAAHTSTGHCSSPTANPLELHFQGLIDEVEIFNRALSQSEIEDIFNAGSAGKCKPCSAFGLADCGDLDKDGLRDDPCGWYSCTAETCSSQSKTTQADLGDLSGACPPDTACDGGDRFHALNCFADHDTTGDPPYPCESSPPNALNVDAGSPSSCALDGVCDANDAFHALNCFSDKWFDGSIGYQCGCPSPGSGPAGAPQPSQPGETPPRLHKTGLTLRAPQAAGPGELVAVDVHLDAGLDALRGYQLHLGAGGGRMGALDLVDISVNAKRRDYVFADTPATWSAFNREVAQMVVGMDEPEGVPAQAGAYLGTFTYRVPKDAAGTFTIEVRYDGSSANPQDRTFLFGRYAVPIDVVSIMPIRTTVAERQIRGRG